MDKLIEKLKEVDEALQVKIKSAHNGMRSSDEDRCSNAREAVQKAIANLLRCG